MASLRVHDGTKRYPRAGMYVPLELYYPQFEERTTDGGRRVITRGISNTKGGGQLSSRRCIHRTCRGPTRLSYHTCRGPTWGRGACVEGRWQCMPMVAAANRVGRLPRPRWPALPSLACAALVGLRCPRRPRRPCRPRRACWRARVHRPFFLDHDSAMSQWEDPRPLPRYWEMKEARLLHFFYAR